MGDGASSDTGSAVRLAAEWEPQSCVWVSRPLNPATWPGCLDRAQAQFDHFVRLLGRRVSVRETAESGIATDDAWVRDYAPLFVVDRGGGLTAHDFRFNSWGGKYPPWDRDDAAGAQIARQMGVPLRRHDQVLEGGSLDANGRGMALTTASCLLDPRRNPGMSRTAIERMLRDALGIRHLVWLSGGIRGDDTDGHVDDAARFIGPRTVAAVRAAAGHPDHVALEANWRTLRSARDQDGQPLELVELPAPPPLVVELPSSPAYDVARRQLPASYANFCIANGAVFVPVFDRPSDAAALAALEASMPGHEVVPVPCTDLVVGLGALHCLTMPVPAHQPRAASQA